MVLLLTQPRLDVVPSPSCHPFGDDTNRINL